MSTIAAIPPQFFGALERYMNNRIPTGDFLERVLSNDLLGAIYFGSTESLAALPQLVKYIHDTLPVQSWGSNERVISWLDGSDAG